MRNIQKAILFLLSPLWIFLSLIELLGIARLIEEIYWPNSDEYKFLLIGLISYVIFVILYAFLVRNRVVNTELRKTLRFYDSLIHELSHLFFVFLTLSRPQELLVKREASLGTAGHVKYTYRLKGIDFLRSHLVSLAPYYFPLLTLVFWVLYLIVKPNPVNVIQRWFAIMPAFHGLFFLLGFSFAYHLHKTIRETRSYQSDFEVVGFFYGLCFILFFHLVFIALILTNLSSDHGSVDILIEFLRGWLFY